MAVSCRFYANRYPEVEEVVMVNVHAVSDVGAHVLLLEYDNVEGMIFVSELTRRRIRSINKLIRVGRNEVVVVVRVDKEKGYIDLSKRRVSPEDIIKCEAKFTKAKSVNNILCHVAELMGLRNGEAVKKLYEKTAWLFDEKYKRQGAAYEAFKHAAMNPEILDACEIDEETKEVLLENIKRRFSPQSVKIRADVEVVCTNYEGIDAVKKALKKGLELSTDAVPIKVNLVSPPRYVITTQTFKRTDGIQALHNAISNIKSSIEDAGGLFSIQLQPKDVSKEEEVEFNKHIEQSENENQESSGDGEDGNEFDGLNNSDDQDFF